MKNIKFFLILLLLLMSLKTIAQDDQFYRSVEFHILNSDYKKIENAKVIVDGKTIPFDSNRQTYYLVDTFKIPFNVTIASKGYDTITYSTSDLQSFDKSFFKGVMWLIKPTGNFYYEGTAGLKIP